MAEIRLSRQAVKDLDSLSKRAAGRIVGILDRLGKDPGTPDLDVKALTGRRPWRRLRVGEHRILFRATKKGRVILVARVVDRKELDRALRSLPG